jgi:mono/diheme cytochrome c family protein
MDELIQQASEQLGFPAELVVRSAQARATADGTSVEAVLAAWGGGEVPAAGEAPPAAPSAAPAAGEAPAAAAAAPAGPAVEVFEASTPVEEATEGDEDEPEAEVEDEPERESSGIPAWLGAAFVLLPLIAVAYALFLPNGPGCGNGAVLAVDPVDGQAVNCDGTPYGETVTDFFAVGQAVYSQCTACHGVTGAGAGNFPAFTAGELLMTFPPGQCNDQVEWVRLGTAGWEFPTYGANEKPVGGSGAAMPGFGEALSEEELRAVVMYERVAFTDQTLEDGLVDCGLGEGAGEEDVEASGE